MAPKQKNKSVATMITTQRTKSESSPPTDEQRDAVYVICIDSEIDLRKVTGDISGVGFPTRQTPPVPGLSG